MYSLICFNSLKLSNNTVTQHLRLDLDQPNIISSKSISSIIADDNLTLTCHVKSNPSASYTWFRKETVIGHTPIMKINVTVEDAGEYKCQATNGYAIRKEVILFKIHRKLYS